jgi:hypothetical protein
MLATQIRLGKGAQRRIFWHLTIGCGHRLGRASQLRLALYRRDIALAKISKIAVVFPSKTGASEEKALAKCYDAMLDTQKDIDTVLVAVGKADPLPKASEEDLKKRLTIAKSRATELKDMAKDRTKGTLHSNPGKLARVFKDLNEDVSNANALEGGLGGALDEEYIAKIKAQLTQVKPLLPEGVSGGSIDITAMVKTLTEAGKANSWKTFAKQWTDFLDDCEEKGRVVGIKALRDFADVKPLKQGSRDSIIDKCVKDKKTYDQAKAALKAALTIQMTPSKSRWASYLDMGAGGSYKLNPASAFEGYTVHWTMSNDTWTAAADGQVKIDSGSAAAVLEKILKSAAGAQAHATLEIGKKADYPHVYMFAGVGNPVKWANAAAQAKTEVNPKNPAASWEADWITRAQTQLTKVMTDLKAELVKKIAAAQANSCDKF